MGKHILLIGVSQAETASLESSPAIANVTALKETLLAEVDGLRSDQVITLVNPVLWQMHHAIALITYQCRHDDLCLIYYSGCGVIDAHSGKFYLSAKDTQLDAITTTAISSDYIRQALPSQQTGLNRVMILDCLWGALSAERSSDGNVDNRLSVNRLADCNCALLTALGNNTQPWPMADTGLSLYTQLLIDGIATGLADINADGHISMGDLQTYMAQTLAETDREIFPIALYPGRDHDNSEVNSANASLLAVKTYSPEQEYRRSVEEYARHGYISPDSRNILDFLCYQLGITPHQGQAIEADVMTPHTSYQESCDRYRQAFKAALELESPLGKPLKRWLRHLQGELSLSYEDVSNIEAQILACQPPYSSVQTLPQWLTPVDTPKLPAHHPNTHLERNYHIG
ncbi:MAG: hypothetical protein AAGA46_07805 [Cyanobacteria bacterium P01_F01_bin.13]